MYLNWTGRRSKAALTVAVALSCLSIGRASADDTKPAQANEPPKTESKPADPHAGHNHGAEAGHQPAGPVKPVNPNEPPTPTVVLKEGEVPAIKFDTPIYDFGRVRSGTDIKHDFFFTNNGTGPLELLRVKPSCGCTVAGQYDRIVQKGETGKIPITLSTKNASGVLTKTITVNTNCSGADSALTLQVKGEVWQPVQVTPQAAAFGRLTTKDAGETLVRKLTIVNNLEEKLTLGEVSSNNPQIKGEVAVLEEGKKYELKVILVPPLGAGNNSGRLTITTNSKEMPTIEVPAYAFITAAVDVTPSSMVLPPNRSAHMSRQFYIRSNVGEEIKITDLEVSNPDLKIELSDIKGGQTYRLKVDVPATYTAPPEGDKITFKTSNKEVPLVVIPITMQPSPAAIRPVETPAKPATDAKSETKADARSESKPG